MMFSYMNSKLYVLFEGPGALLTLDDDKVGLDCHLGHHRLLFDWEVGSVRSLHWFSLHMEGSGGGSERRTWGQGSCRG